MTNLQQIDFFELSGSRSSSDSLDLAYADEGEESSSLLEHDAFTSDWHHIHSVGDVLATSHTSTKTGSVLSSTSTVKTVSALGLAVTTTAVTTRRRISSTGLGQQQGQQHQSCSRQASLDTGAAAAAAAAAGVDGVQTKPPQPSKFNIPSSLVTLNESEKRQLEDVLMRIGLKDCGL